MFKIIKSVFETNSSSVHTLTVKKNLNVDEDILKSIREIIYPFTEEELKVFKYRDNLYVFTSIRDKLRYIWSCAIQANELEAGYKLLKEICPNVEYIYRPYNYIFEDGEWLFDEDESDISDKWTIEQWKKWFVAGDVVVFSRDLYDRYDDTLDKDYYKQEEKVKESHRETLDNDYDCISWEG